MGRVQGNLLCASENYGGPGKWQSEKVGRRGCIDQGGQPWALGVQKEDLRSEIIHTTLSPQ